MGINGYDQVLPRTWELYQQARIITFVSTKIHCKVIKTTDYVADLPIMALSTSKGAEQPTTICFAYREPTGGVSGLVSLKSKKERLNRILMWWKELEARGGDLVIMGDINLDWQKWGAPD